MKRFTRLLISLLILCLAVVPLAGCVSKSEYEALRTERATLMEENARLKAEYQSLQTEHTALTEQNTHLKAELERVQPNLTAMEEAYATLERDYAAIEAELTEIKRVYPLKHFADRYELRDWLDKRFPELGQVGPIKHFELQEIALADGYIWSVGCWPRLGVASYCVAGNVIYWVDYLGNIQAVGGFIE